MFWIFYFFASLFFSLLLADLSKKYYKYLFVIFFVGFLTPTQIELQNADFAPSIFTFFYNLLFQENFSTRVLRPLILTLPISLVLLMIYDFIKRKFF